MPKATKSTVTIVLDVEIAQELAASSDSTVRKIDWVLENKAPTRKGEAERLDLRAKQLTLAAEAIRKALNDRAKAETNVVKIGAKK
jgi:sugar/nucleoside kinase (ribokinase family)